MAEPNTYFTFYLTNDSATATTHVTAQEWAQTVYLPYIFTHLVVALAMHFIIVYEYLLHLQSEIAIWIRLIRRKNPTRPILPWSTLWLRYSLLVEFALLLIVMYNKLTSTEPCYRTVIPALYAWTTILSVSTGFVAGWRAQTIAKAAFPSGPYYALVRICNSACLFARLASHIIAFSLQSLTTHKLEEISAIGGNHSGFASCFARADTKLITAEGLVRTFDTGPTNAFIALLATVFITDLIFGTVTLLCTLKLRKVVHLQSILLDQLLVNTVKFYSLLFLIDIFSTITYAVLRLPNLVMFRISGGAVLMIRVLLDEQQCIIAYSRKYSAPTKTPWLEITGDFNRSHGNQAREQGIRMPHLPRGGSGVPKGRHHGAVCRGGAGCCSCRHISSALQLRRGGAGLTDIEQVTVLEQPCSFDRTYSPSADDVRLDRGFRSLIAEWTRQTAGAMIMDDADKEGVKVSTAHQNISRGSEKGCCTLDDEKESGDEVDDIIPSPSSCPSRDEYGIAFPTMSSYPSAPPPACDPRSPHASI